MRQVCVASVVVAVLSAGGAAAQPAGDQLNDTQKLGQALFVQSCGVCHLKPQLNSPQFAPVLSKDTLGGQENTMREVISNGTPRMPGFKYQFDQTQIAAIAAYLKTVSSPAAGAAAAPVRREGRDAD
jgi:mono/diheme cytochrome c family protein